MDQIRVWRATGRQANSAPGEARPEGQDPYYGWAHVGDYPTSKEAEAAAAVYEGDCYLEPIEYVVVPALTPKEALQRGDASLAQEKHAYISLAVATKVEKP